MVWASVACQVAAGRSLGPPAHGGGGFAEGPPAYGARTLRRRLGLPGAQPSHGLHRRDVRQRRDAAGLRARGELSGGPGGQRGSGQASGRALNVAVAQEILPQEASASGGVAAVSAVEMSRKQRVWPLFTQFRSTFRIVAAVGMCDARDSAEERLLRPSSEARVDFWPCRQVIWSLSFVQVLEISHFMVWRSRF